MYLQRLFLGQLQLPLSVVRTTEQSHARTRVPTCVLARNLWGWAFPLPIRCITHLLLMGPLCIPTETFLELSWLPQHLLGAHLICFSFTS